MASKNFAMMSVTPPAKVTNPHALQKREFMGRECFTCTGCGRLYRDRGQAARDGSCPLIQKELFS